MILVIKKYLFYEYKKVFVKVFNFICTPGYVVRTTGRLHPETTALNMNN